MNTLPFPEKTTAIDLQSTIGTIQAIVEYPENNQPTRPIIAIICHPLPTEGGTMENKVVTTAARALREMGIITLRFNFRGVGTSAGVFDEGRGETDDLVLISEWVRQQCPNHTLWLAGFSFGSYVSLKAAAHIQPHTLISIAPPAGRWEFNQIQSPECHWLVVQGEADEVVSPQAVFDWVEQQPQPPILVKMPETSHFFHRKLVDLREIIQHITRQWLV